MTLWLIGKRSTFTVMEKHEVFVNKSGKLANMNCHYYKCLGCSKDTIYIYIFYTTLSVILWNTSIGTLIFPDNIIDWRNIIINWSLLNSSTQNDD